MLMQAYIDIEGEEINRLRAETPVASGSSRVRGGSGPSFLLRSSPFLFDKIYLNRASPSSILRAPFSSVYFIARNISLLVQQTEKTRVNGCEYESVWSRSSLRVCVCVCGQDYSHSWRRDSLVARNFLLGWKFSRRRWRGSTSYPGGAGAINIHRTGQVLRKWINLASRIKLSAAGASAFDL